MENEKKLAERIIANPDCDMTNWRACRLLDYLLEREEEEPLGRPTEVESALWRECLRLMNEVQEVRAKTLREAANVTANPSKDILGLPMPSDDELAKLRKVQGEIVAHIKTAEEGCACGVCDAIRERMAKEAEGGK